MRFKPPVCVSRVLKSNANRFSNTGPTLGPKCIFPHMVQQQCGQSSYLVSDLKSLYGGMRSTETIMLNILQRNGIERVEPLGEIYDPATSRAIAQVTVSFPGKLCSLPIQKCNSVTGLP